MIRYKCVQCGTDLQSPSSLANQLDVCPFCQYGNTVPQATGMSWSTIGFYAGVSVLALAMIGGAVLWSYSQTDQKPDEVALGADESKTDPYQGVEHQPQRRPPETKQIASLPPEAKPPVIRAKPKPAIQTPAKPKAPPRVKPKAPRRVKPKVSPPAKPKAPRRVKPKVSPPAKPGRPAEIAGVPPEYQQQARNTFAKGYTFFIWSAEPGPFKRGDSQILIVPFRYVTQRRPRPYKTAFGIVLPGHIETLILKGQGPAAVRRSGEGAAMHLDFNRSYSGKGKAIIHLLDYGAKDNKQVSNEFTVDVEF